MGDSIRDSLRISAALIECLLAGNAGRIARRSHEMMRADAIPNYEVKTMRKIDALVKCTFLDRWTMKKAVSV